MEPQQYEKSHNFTLVFARPEQTIQFQYPIFMSTTFSGVGNKKSTKSFVTLIDSILSRTVTIRY